MGRIKDLAISKYVVLEINKFLAYFIPGLRGLGDQNLYCYGNQDEAGNQK